MSTTGTGQAAEAAAADYLERLGFKIIERNYRTPQCEIDIIARKNTCTYFVEVKYRERTVQGSGLEYITAQKRTRMERAAERWLQEHPWSGEVCLSAIELEGDFRVTNFIETL